MPGRWLSVLLTGAVLPSLLLHEMVELVGAVAGMLLHRGVDLLRAQFAPRVAAASQRAADDVGLLVLGLVHEQCLLAPTIAESKTSPRDDAWSD